MRPHDPHPRHDHAGASLAALTCAAALLLASAHAQAQGTASPSRGQLLYATHCVACHDTQKHWRDNRVVRDWGGLVGQVRRWQGTQGLQWTDTDIEDVARHLNDRFYKLPQPGVRQGLQPTTPGARG